MNSLLEAMNMPAAALTGLFGAGLAGLVAAGFQRQRKLTPAPTTAEIRAFARRLSRFVYLSLYCLFGLNEVSALLAGMPPEAAAAGLGGYLAAGISVLVLIQVLAAAWNHAADVGRGRRKPLLLTSA